MADGRTYLAAGSKIIVTDTAGAKLEEISLSVSAARQMRMSANKTFLYGNGSRLIESDSTGAKVRDVQVGGDVYEVLKLADGSFWATTGYGREIVHVGADQSVLKRVTAPAEATPNFFAGFQILSGGTIVMTNWEGHGGGNGAKGVQLIEFDTSGTVVSNWKQDASFVSSLHGVLVLDNIDTGALHTEVTGQLKPAGQTGLAPHGWRTGPGASPAVNMARVDLLGRLVLERNTRGLCRVLTSPDGAELPGWSLARQTR